MKTGTKKTKPTKSAGHDVPPDGPSGHWTQWIKPKGAALLAETLGHAHFVIKNHGPKGVTLVAACGDLMDLPAGAVRVTHAYGRVRVENMSDIWVLIEFDFLPGVAGEPNGLPRLDSEVVY
jgi:hypothetical protein